MTRIERLFSQKQGGILNIYCTAGYPRLDSTLEVMEALEQHGADIIELGMPYSDPLADGPVIQQSSAQAIANGMSVPLLIDQLQNFRPRIKVPVVLMGYLNPVLQYGFEKFCADIAAVGIDGLIIPDLPLEIYKSQYKEIVQRHHLNFIFLVTPETAEQRIREMDREGSGFLYAVSSSSITGTSKNFEGVEPYLGRLKSLQLKLPVLVGFGISDKQGFEAVCKMASGGIIGTAFIKAIGKAGDLNAATKNFLGSIKDQ